MEEVGRQVRGLGLVLLAGIVVSGPLLAGWWLVVATWQSITAWMGRDF